MPHPMKKTYLDTAQTTLRAIDERLDRLHAAAIRLASERRDGVDRMLDTLRGIRNRAGAKLEDVRRAPEDAWTDVRMHAEKAIAELTAGIDRLEATLRAVAA